jgi:hypothetical protein
MAAMPQSRPAIPCMPMIRHIPAYFTKHGFYDGICQLDHAIKLPESAKLPFL